MIYLIGGVPRVGKTTLAKLLLQRKGIPFVPTDTLAHTLTHMYPQLGIQFGKEGAWENIPDQFYPFLKSFVHGVKYHISDYTVEGDAFFPAHAQKLIEEEKDIRCCFLGASSITLEDIRKYAFDDWVGDLPEKRQKEIPAWIMEKSLMLKAESEKRGIPYFDMAIDREKTLEAAYQFLTA